MQFGTKKKDAVEKNNGSGNYLRNFKAGSLVVRFLEEPSEWLAIYEHFTPDNRSFPCTEDDNCPGCNSDIERTKKATRKYATQLYLVEQKRVLPFRIPISVADKMVNRAEKNDGRITTRDFAVMRSGAGLETEYDVDSEDKYGVDVEDLLKKVEVDIQDCLREAFEENSGVSLAPSKEEKPKEVAKDEEKVYTETDIRSMSKPELRELCTKYFVKFEDDASSRELADMLVKTFGHEDGN